jgi:hypothetical protein
MCGSESLIIGALPLATFDSRTMVYLIEMALRHFRDIQQHLMAVEPDTN